MTVKNKTTIDLSAENKTFLDNIKKNKKIPVGGIINNILSIFFRIPKDVRYELLEFCENRKQQLQRELITAGDFSYASISNKIKAYDTIYDAFSDFDNNSVDETSMMKLNLQDGYMYYPSNWILLNPEDAAKTNYACVVECRNSTKYNIPHFVYLNNVQSAEFYTSEFKEAINERILHMFPLFADILERQIEPIFEKGSKIKLLNEDEWLKAPTIGYFNLFVKSGDNDLLGYEPPAGAYIYRKAMKK